jgi:LmbE family N-acetylglucosaminyl deacetylase
MVLDLARRSASGARREDDLLAQILDASLETPRRIVVATPHPDDEILGLGAFLSRCAVAGTLVEIVAVSDGERAYVDADEATRQRLVETRANERALALRALRLAASPVHRLGIADGAIAEAEQLVSDRLVELLRLRAMPPLTTYSTVLVSTWRHDLHPDHEAVGRAAFAAAATFGCELWEVPIWSWYHLGELEMTLPVARTARIPLRPPERAAKRRALGIFQSQLRPPAPHGPVLPDDFLEVLDRDFEIILR